MVPHLTSYNSSEDAATGVPRSYRLDEDPLLKFDLLLKVLAVKKDPFNELKVSDGFQANLRSPKQQKISLNNCCLNRVLKM